MQKSQVKGRNNSIDLVKWIAALLVVSIHSNAFSDISPTLGYVINSALGRMAVPFFACVTGYFLTEYTAKNPKAWLKNLKSLVKYYVFLSAVYVLWDIICHHYDGMSIGAIIYTVVRRFIVYGTYYHLWFFPSMILAVVVLHFAIKWKKEKIGWIVCILSFVFGSLTYTWHSLIPWEQMPILNRLMAWYDFDYIRRFITSVCPFTFLGNFLSCQKKIWSKTYSEKHCSGIISGMMIVWMLLDVIEIEAANQLGLSAGTTGSFCLLFSTLFLFLFLLMHPANTERMARIGRFGGGASMILYGFHPLIMEIIQQLANLTPTMIWCITVLVLCIITWGWQQRHKLHTTEKG